MAKGLQTFLSYKYLKDASGIQYLVLISHVSNPVIGAAGLGKGFTLTPKTVSTLKDGNREQVYTYTGSGNVTANFKEGQTITISVSDIPKGSELAVPFDSLERSFNFDVSSESLLGYDISDALFYSEGTASYRESYILPQSSNPHLDTSSRTDFYYTADGSAAYMGSTSLQNKFLNNIGYSNRGSDSTDLGKFRGGSDDNTSVEFTTTHQTPVAGQTTGPATQGGIVAFSFIPRTSAVDDTPLPIIDVCQDPQATNFYLTGCINEELPCVDSGTTHANDCEGVALTADIINNSVLTNGSCCEYTTGCEDFNVVIGDITAANIDVANGTVNVTVSGGTQNYTAVVGAIELDNPENSFSTQTTNSISTDEFTLSSLFPGKYNLSVTDSTSGTACNQRIEFIVPPKGSDPGGEGDFGCKDTSSAINHDNSVTTHQDRLCVFCDADSGLLFADSTNPTFLGNAFVPTSDSPIFNFNNATSTPEGVSIENGSLTFLGVQLFNEDINLSEPPAVHNFNPLEEFTTDQASMFDYQLYRIDSEVDGLLNEINLAESGNVKAWLTANATAVGSVVQTTGAAHSFTSLGPGTYTVLVTYDADGTPNGDPEEEQCYYVPIPQTVYQRGCTDPTADNYNTAFESDPNSFLPSEGCFYPPQTCNDPGIVFDAVVSCNADDGTIQIDSIDFVSLNPDILDAGVNGFIVTQDHVNPPFGAGVIVAAGGSGFAALQYIAWELFCYDLFNSSIDPNMHWMSLPVGFPQGYVNSEGVVPASGAGNLANMYRILSTITFADGTDLFLGEIGLGDLLPNTVPFDTPNLVNYGEVTCEHISTHGTPTSVTFNYNYGEYNVYGESASYTHIFTISQLEQFTGCCEFSEPEPEGCTDPTATNFDPAAIIDDGSCIYPEPPVVPGCTDPTATNFDPLATVDDGSCEYIQQGSWLQADCFTCSYNENFPNGFETQEECEDSIESNTDCCVLETYVNNAGDIMGTLPVLDTTNSSSIFNDVTGLCDDQSTGSFVFTFPSGLNNSVFNMTSNVSFFWRVGTLCCPSVQYSNIWSGALTNDFGEVTDAITNMDTSDLIDLTGATQSITVNGIESGQYIMWFYFFDIPFDATGADPINGLPYQDGGQSCTTYTVNIDIGIDDCDDSIVHGCTDPEADNYNESATVDDGTCTYTDINDDNPDGGDGGDPGGPGGPDEEVGCDCGDGTYSPACCPPTAICGCQDPNASNFNPNATYYDPTADGCGCEYDGDPPFVGDPPITSTVLACVPRTIHKLIRYNNECIARAGHRVYTKHITGLGNSCSNMETMKMVIINDLISRLGLPCIFNCSDNDTPAPDTASNVCKDNWTNNGSLYWNPADAAANIYNLGIHVRRPFVPNPGGLPAPIYVAISNSGLDIDPFSNNSASGWKLCKTESIVNEKNNYLPNFLKFAHEYCKNCGIPPYRIDDTLSSSVTDTFTTGGNDITAGGTTFDNTSDQTDLTTLDDIEGNETDNETGGLYS